MLVLQSRVCVQTVLVCCLYLAALVCADQRTPGVERTRTPIILIPGLAGSVIDTRLSANAALHWTCRKTKGWHVLYMSFIEFLRPDCLCDELALFYDVETSRYSNQVGVEIRSHDFGGLGGLDALDPYVPQYTGVFRPLTLALKAIGYRERVDLWGAPYDWRMAADGLVDNGFFRNLTDLIEDASAAMGGRPVLIIAHSMGNLVLSYFMKLWDVEWTRRHVAKVIGVSGPWGGAVPALKAPISGSNFHLFFPHNLLHSVQGTVASAAWILPSPQLWNDSEVVLSTRSAVYTAGNVSDLLHDAGLRQLSLLYPRVSALVQPIREGTFPVPLTCVHGNGVPTVTSYRYNVQELKAWTAPEPSSVTADEGDGTVNLRSLRACELAGTPSMTTTVEIDGAGHLGILSSDALVLEVISSLGISPASVPAALEAADGGRELGCQPLWRKLASMWSQPWLWMRFVASHLAGYHRDRDRCLNGRRAWRPGRPGSAGDVHIH